MRLAGSSTGLPNVAEDDEVDESGSQAARGRATHECCLDPVLRPPILQCLWLPRAGAQVVVSPERSLSTISHAWSITWNAQCRMRKGRFHERIRFPSPTLYARIAAT